MRHYAEKVVIGESALRKEMHSSGKAHYGVGGFGEYAPEGVDAGMARIDHCGFRIMEPRIYEGEFLQVEVGSGVDSHSFGSGSHIYVFHPVVERRGGEANPFPLTRQDIVTYVGEDIIESVAAHLNHFPGFAYGQQFTFDYEFGFIVEEDVGAGLNREGGAGAHCKGIEDDIWAIGGEGHILIYDGIAKPNYVLSPGFYAHFLLVAVEQEEEVVADAEGTRVGVFGQIALDENEDGVASANLYVREIVTADAVDIHRERGIGIFESDRRDIDALFIGIKDFEACGGGSEVGEDGIEIHGIGREFESQTGGIIEIVGDATYGGSCNQRE